MFLIHKTDDGRIPDWEYLPASAITPKVGTALVMNGGKLDLATGANKPAYICMAERDAAVTAGDIIPVIRVQADMIFETEFYEDATSIVPGNKLTIHTDGLRVTKTTTDGVAEVVEILGTAAGDKVRVRFA